MWDGNSWGAFCGGADSFTAKSADVACKQMEYESGKLIGEGAYGSCE